MKYHDLIHKVKSYSGVSLAEAKDALDCMVEVLAVHLADRERRNFASRLPEELQNMALAVLPTEQNARADIFAQYMANMHVKEPRARREMQAAWRALKETVGNGEIEHIRSQLPHRTMALLR